MCIRDSIDYCIDFHTGGARRFNSSQIRVSKDNYELLELAKIFNPKFIVFAGQREKSFRRLLLQSGKKYYFLKVVKHSILTNGLHNVVCLLYTSDAADE